MCGSTLCIIIKRLPTKVGPGNNTPDVLPILDGPSFIMFDMVLFFRFLKCFIVDITQQIFLQSLAEIYDMELC